MLFETKKNWYREYGEFMDKLMPSSAQFPISRTEVLRLITSARGAMNGLMAEVFEDHVRYHVVNPKERADSERVKAAAELIAIVHSYLK
jgi:Metal-sensitive transcriptional repressor